MPKLKLKKLNKSTRCNNIIEQIFYNFHFYSQHFTLERLAYDTVEFDLPIHTYFTHLGHLQGYAELYLIVFVSLKVYQSGGKYVQGKTTIMIASLPKVTTY